MALSAVAPITGLSSPLLDGLLPRDLNSILAAATQRRLLSDSIAINQGILLTIFSSDQRSRPIFLCYSRGSQNSPSLACTRRRVRWHGYLVPASVYLVSTELLKGQSRPCWGRATIRSLAAEYPRLMDNALSIAADYIAWISISTQI